MSVVVKPHTCWCELGYHQGYPNPQLDSDLQNGQLGHTKNTYPVDATTHCEYNALYKGFGADKMK